MKGADKSCGDRREWFCHHISVPGQDLPSTSTYRTILPHRISHLLRLYPITSALFSWGVGDARGYPMSYTLRQRMHMIAVFDESRPCRIDDHLRIRLAPDVLLCSRRPIFVTRSLTWIDTPLAMPYLEVAQHLRDFARGTPSTMHQSICITGWLLASARGSEGFCFRTWKSYPRRSSRSITPTAYCAMTTFLCVTLADRGCSTKLVQTIGRVQIHDPVTVDSFRFSCAA